MKPIESNRVPPLTEGYVVKGGQNQGPSQITTRPPPPAPINRPIEQARAEMTAAGASAEHKAFMERAGKIIETATKFKKALQSRNLTRGRAKCPHCDSGHLHGQIIGRKAHFHFACDSCDVSMME
jgi:hypothetical protein